MNFADLCINRFLPHCTNAIHNNAEAPLISLKLLLLVNTCSNTLRLALSKLHKSNNS